MTTRLRLWTVLLVGFLLAGPVDAGGFNVLGYEEPRSGASRARRGIFRPKTSTWYHTFTSPGRSHSFD